MLSQLEIRLLFSVIILSQGKYQSQKRGRKNILTNVFRHKNILMMFSVTMSVETSCDGVSGGQNSVRNFCDVQFSLSQTSIRNFSKSVTV